MTILVLTVPRQTRWLSSTAFHRTEKVGSAAGLHTLPHGSTSPRNLPKIIWQIL
nr:MAG TPA: hypothetical protein [Caudoviricetes sp.]